MKGNIKEKNLETVMIIHTVHNSLYNVNLETVMIIHTVHNSLYNVYLIPTCVVLSSWSTLKVGNDAASNTQGQYCIQYLHSVCLHLWLYNFCFATIVAETWNTLDAEIDPASNTGKICLHPVLAFSFAACMHASIFLFYIITYWTGNPLFTSNNTASQSNACKHLGCIQ